MKDQVLSIEQMRELIDMGIDTSKASIYWRPSHKTGWNDPKLDLIYDERYIPTFTLQNMLDMLPNSIEWEGKIYWFTVFINGLNHKMIGYRDPELWAVEFNINGAFEYIKWCKENNFI